MQSIIKHYTINDKKILIEKINEIKDKYQIKKIKQIIFKENPNLSVTKNSSGILLFFHNLNNSTYSKLFDYFKIVDQKRIDEITIRSNELKSSEYYDDITDDITDDTILSSDKNLKLSVMEKNYINKNHYYSLINNNDDDIFFKKD
jgi:membrane protease subunit (stomatin/prohibitin family)